MRTSPVSYERHIPGRTCLGCRAVKNKRDLLRVVRTPEGGVHVDPGGKESGRGAYVCRDEACLRKVLKTGALARSLKTQIPAEVGERLLREVLQ
jgi:predicted RNA-binding protein YlxR (DUF448 family)